MKKVLLFITVIAILIINLWDISFAESEESKCEACFVSPEGIDDYMSFVSDVLSHLSSSTEKYYFDSDEFENEITKWFKNVAEWTIDLYEKIIWETNLNVWLPFYSSLWLDFYNNFTIVRKPYPVVRDRKKLALLDQPMSDRSVFLNSRWIFDLAIPEDKLADINWLMWSLDYLDWVEFKNGISYWKVLSFVWKLNMLNKWIFMYAVDDYWESDDILEYIRFLKKWYDWRVFFPPTFEINVIDHANYLHEQYKCVVFPDVYWKKCPSWDIDEFLKNIEDIAAFSEDWWDIQDQIQRSYNRLKAVMRDLWVDWFSNITEEDINDYEERKRMLVWQYYWSDEFYDYMDKWWMWWVWYAWESVKEESKELLEEINEDLLEPLDRAYSSIMDAEYWRVYEEKYTDDLKLSVDGDIVRDNFVAWMKNVYENVIAIESEYTKDVTIHDPVWVTKNFPDLSKLVYKWIVLVWSEDSENDNSLVHNMWEACELQCSNYWWICWYY